MNKLGFVRATLCTTALATVAAFSLAESAQANTCYATCMLDDFGWGSFHYYSPNAGPLFNLFFGEMASNTQMVSLCTRAARAACNAANNIYGDNCTVMYVSMDCYGYGGGISCPPDLTVQCPATPRPIYQAVEPAE